MILFKIGFTLKHYIVLYMYAFYILLFSLLIGNKHKGYGVKGRGRYQKYTENEGSVWKS